MKILGIIPARYDSVRLEGKPLAMIAGKPMIQRVYEQCKKAAKLSAVIVATDDERIYKTVKDFGGKVMMTSSTHLNGTSRCAEVAARQAEFHSESFEYIINIQGDEPLINPNQIDELASIFIDKRVEISTQVKIETNLSLLENTNIVKAILDENNFAIDFKREITNESLIFDVHNNESFYKHIGIYGFKKEVLQKIVALKPSENELQYHLEQLRWLDNGFKIKAGITNYESKSVDTQEDLVKVILQLKEK